MLQAKSHARADVGMAPKIRQLEKGVGPVAHRPIAPEAAPPLSCLPRGELDGDHAQRCAQGRQQYVRYVCNMRW